MSALEALDHIRRSYPQARLLVAGRYDETDPVPQSTRDKLERDPAVTMLGQVSDIPQLLNSIDVLVFPSAREGFPNAVIEAAACGVPTVGWDVTGVRDAILDGVTGAVVAKGETARFASAVEEWALRPKSETVAVCRDWATKFDENLVTEALVAFLAELHFKS